MLDKLKNILGKGVCIEFDYYPRRGQIIAKIPIEVDIEGNEFLRLKNTLEQLGFKEFWIHKGECDILEDKYHPSEIVFYSDEGVVSPKLVEELVKRRGRIVICGR